MVQIKLGDKVLHINDILKENLDEVKAVVNKKDWDYVCIVAGRPGVGKSTLAQQMAKYCDPNFSHENVAFTSEEFIEITNKVPKNSAVILDESFESMNSRVAMSPEFIKIVNHLQIIRQKNLYIFLCLPNFFDLAKGIAVYRSHHLIVCYSQRFGHRGTFGAFSTDKKRKLYVEGKKYMNYNACKPNFRGTFPGIKVIEWEEYEKKKLEHLKRRRDTEAPKERFDKMNEFIYHLKEDGMNVEKIAKLSKLDVSSIYRRIREHKQHLYTKNSLEN